MILSLGLGLGVSLVFFTAFMAALVKPLPFPDADQLVVVNVVRDVGGNERTWQISEETAEELRRNSRTLIQLGAFTEFESMLGQPGDAEGRPVTACRATGSFFDTIGVRPDEGRAFERADEVRGAPLVAIVRRDLWQSLFGAARLSGQSVVLGGKSYSVVGILPSDFEFTRLGATVWLPGRQGSATVGRLRPGMGPEAAHAEILASLPAGDFTVRVDSIREHMVGVVRDPLIALMATSFVMLAMMCFNMVNFVVVRTEARKKSDAIRRALGASPGRLLRRQAGENLLLCSCGSLLAWGLAEWLLAGLRALIPLTLPRIEQVEIGRDGILLLLAVPVLLTLLLSSISMFLRAGAGFSDILGLSRGAGASRPRASRFRRLVLAGEVTVALVLVHSALLLTDSFRRLSSVDPGFDHTSVHSVEARLPWGFTTSGAVRREQLGEILERVRALPGIESAGLSTSLPFAKGLSEMSMRPEGYVSPSGDDPVMHTNTVDRGYLATLGLRFVQGGVPEDRGDQAVVLVNEEFARQFFPDRRAVGRRIHASEDFRIVGVLEDAKQTDLVTPTYAEVYFLLEEKLVESPFLLGRAHIVLRMGESSPVPFADIRGIIQAAVPNSRILGTHGLDGLIAESIGLPLFWNAVIGSMGAIGFLLAVIGIYGVASSSVGSRLQELAIRRAVGASPRQLSKCIFLEVLSSVVPGVMMGLAAATFSGRVFSGLLYGLEPSDPAVFALVALTMAAAAVLGSWSPSRKASRIDPIAALRHV